MPFIGRSRRQSPLCAAHFSVEPKKKSTHRKNVKNGAIPAVYYVELGTILWLKTKRISCDTIIQRLLVKSDDLFLVGS